MARITHLEAAAEGGLIGLGIALILLPFLLVYWLWRAITANDYNR